jgi:hypothetical protein
MNENLKNNFNGFKDGFTKADVEKVMKNQEKIENLYKMKLLKNILTT